MSDARPHPPLALIAEATKRAGLIWVTVPGQGRPRAVWHIWRAAAPAGTAGAAAAAAVDTSGGAGTGPAGDTGTGGAAYVLTGPGEQTVPGLATTGTVTVTVASKDTGGQLVTWDATVTRVDPASAEWAAITGPLLAGRLNAPAAPEGGSPAGRWAQTAAVYRLRPTPFDAARAAQ